MFMTGLRAAAIAIIGVAAAVPAYADAQVQNAVKFWSGELSTAYTATVTSLGSGKIQQGKIDIAKLAELAPKMEEMVKGIADDANELAPELALSWAETQRASQDFNAAVQKLLPTVGKQKPELGELQSTKSALDAAWPKALEGTKTFGKKYGELMQVVEQAKQLLAGDLTGTFNATVDYLEYGNTDDGVVALKLLRERTTYLYKYSDQADTKAKELARVLADHWTPAYDEFKAFQIALGTLEYTVGTDDYTDELEDLQSTFGELNAAMMESYKEILEFGSGLVAISDDWR